MLVGLVVMFPLLLAACGGAPAGRGVPAVSPAAGVAVTAARTEAPVDGQSVLDRLIGQLSAGHPDVQVDDAPSNGQSRWQVAVWLRKAGGAADGQVKVAVYATTADRDGAVNAWRTSGLQAMFPSYLIVGDHFTATAFNADDAQTAARALGGQLVT